MTTCYMLFFEWHDDCETIGVFSSVEAVKSAINQYLSRIHSGADQLNDSSPLEFDNKRASYHVDVNTRFIVQETVIDEIVL